MYQRDCIVWLLSSGTKAGVLPAEPAVERLVVIDGETPAAFKLKHEPAPDPCAGLRCRLQPHLAHRLHPDDFSAHTHGHRALFPACAGVGHHANRVVHNIRHRPRAAQPTGGCVPMLGQALRPASQNQVLMLEINPEHLARPCVLENSGVGGVYNEA